MSSPIPSWLNFLSIPASLLYGCIVRIRNSYYDKPSVAQKVDKPVISVGNLTVGGTGKTPLVTWIIQTLRKNGYHPAVVMRGYASVDPSKADEALEYRERILDIDVIVGADRVSTINAYLQNGGKADCFVMDDGFQHRRLHRDLDIVVMDFLRDAFSQRMLPAGWLREPISGLARADAVVVSHARISDPNFASKVEQVLGEQPVAWTSHHWSGLSLFEESGERKETLDWLTGKSVAVRLGIGYPGPVIEALVRLGTRVARQLHVGDHQPFTTQEVLEIVQTSGEVDAVVMTLKDWVKARDVMALKDMQCPVVVPDLTLEVVEGAKQLEVLLLTVLQDTMNT